MGRAVEDSGVILHTMVETHPRNVYLVFNKLLTLQLTLFDHTSWVGFRKIAESEQEMQGDVAQFG
jgi:hypothetical protein